MARDYFTTGQRQMAEMIEETKKLVRANERRLIFDHAKRIWLNGGLGQYTFE